MRVFSSNSDILNFARELADLARENGDLLTAQSLHTAIQGNFITSEILGELCSVLEKVLEERDMEYLNPFREDVNSAISAIKKAFTRANRPW